MHSLHADQQVNQELQSMPANVHLHLCSSCPLEYHPFFTIPGAYPACIKWNILVLPYTKWMIKPHLNACAWIWFVALCLEDQHESQSKEDLKDITKSWFTISLAISLKGSVTVLPIKYSLKPGDQIPGLHASISPSYACGKGLVKSFHKKKDTICLHLFYI